MGDLTDGASLRDVEVRWDRDDMDVLKRTVVRGADLTDAEWKLFAYVSQTAGLNPLLKQIYATKFRNSRGDESLVFITSIDGYRSIAERAHLRGGAPYGGSDDYLYNDNQTMYQVLKAYADKVREQKKATPNWQEESKVQPYPHTATCTVYKIIEGMRCPTAASARWVEYFPRDKRRQWNWKDRPFLMLGKCAEALALRKAYPLLFRGLYADVEMNQAGFEKPESEMDHEAKYELIENIKGTFHVLGFNKARQIAFCVEATGKSSLEEMRVSELELVEKGLESEKDRMEVSSYSEEKEYDT